MLSTGIFILLTVAGTCIAHEEVDIELLLKQVVEIIDYMLKDKKDEHGSPCENTTDTRCENGWIRYGGSCYLFVARKLSYSHARRNCLDLGGHLVYIESFEENTFLANHLRTLKEDSHWIGLTDIKNEGHFTWENGKSLTFYDWHTGQPDNAGGKDNCAHFHAPFNYKWNDWLCSKIIGSICEKTN